MQCNKKAALISKALVGAAKYLGKRANDRISHHRRIQFNQYHEAIRSLELALMILPADHPSRPHFTTGIEHIRKILASLKSELNEQLSTLKTMLETGTYAPDVWTEIRLTFERVRVLVLAIGKDDDRPRNLAEEYVEKFRRHGQYEHARIATKLNEAVDVTLGLTPQYSDEELILFGVIDYLAQRQKMERQRKITGLAGEVIAALDSKKLGVAVDKAREVLKLGPTGRRFRQMQAVIAQIEGTSGQIQRTKEARRVIAETLADIEPVRLPEVQVEVSADKAIDSPTAVSTADRNEQPVVDHRPPKERLKEILRQYEQKQLYQALSGLEALYHDKLSNRERRKIAELRQVWTPDRKRLVDGIVREADRLFVLMDERSLSEYKRAQQLSPKGETADHIKKRIEILEQILKD